MERFVKSLRIVIAVIMLGAFVVPARADDACKNLFDISQSATTERVSASLVWQRYNIVIPNFYQGDWFAKHVSNVSPGTYISSHGVIVYDGNNIYRYNPNTPFTLNTISEIWFFRPSNDWGNVLHVQLEKGSTATDWVPYNPSCWGIKIATTAHNAAAFESVEQSLNATVSTIRDIVTNTINQTAAIAQIASDKRPARMKAVPLAKNVYWLKPKKL